jgi:ELWxxDGT repeat protein
MKSLAVCALLALLAIPAAGIEPYLVKDINPVATPAGSEPTHLVNFGGAVLFFANDGVTGRHLWRTHGTAASNVQLSSAGESGFADAMPLAVTERLYFFVSSHPLLSPASLWVTDGTAVGTFQLTDPSVGVVSLTRAWVASQGVLYFVARDAEHGAELWRTDGTPGGTRLVEDIRPGPQDSDIRELTPYRGRSWFSVDDGQHGGALWRSNGTEAGTALAVDPVPGSSSHVGPEHIRAVGHRLTFFARSPGRGRVRQLWAGDGTTKGTHPVTSFSTRVNAALEAPVVHGNRLWFVANDRFTRQLWVSDGTGRGTRMLLSMPFDSSSYSLFGEQGLRGLFVFQWPTRNQGVELWITDGTAQGTRILFDVCPGSCSSTPIPVKMFKGRLYFLAEEADHETHLWSTDGTPEGTRQVSDADLAGAFGFTALGDRLLFVARNGDEGWEVWRTDGTPAGTVPVTDFEPRFLWDEEGFYGAVLNGQLLFNADDGVHGLELWRTDGTAAGTELVEDINRLDLGGSFPSSLRPLGDEVVFAVHAGSQLWKSDGTAEGTVLFRTFGPDERGGAQPVGGFAEAGGLLFYFAALGYLPWRTDGTAEGTFPLTDEAAPGAGCCVTREMVAVGNLVFFDLEDEEHGHEPWVSDGTRKGTHVLDVIPGPGDSLPLFLTVFQGNLYFAAGGLGLGRELWRSDGTAAGTVPLDLVPGGVGSNPGFLTVHAGRLWFFAEDEHGIELWSSDGTLAGSRLEVDFVPGPDSFLPRFMASLGDRLVISFHGEGLWATDGTPAGTRKIHDRDFDPGTDPEVVFQGRLYYVSAATGTIWVTDGTEAGTGPLLDRDGNQIFSPGQFAILGDRLVFIAPDGLGSLTLWESDGTPAGTFPVEPRVNIGGELVRAGDRVFFAAYDTSTGWELWAVER